MNSHATFEDFQAYYETSAKTGINVLSLFADAARIAAKSQAYEVNAREAREGLKKLSGATGMLPWNLAKKAKCEFPSHGHDSHISMLTVTT